MLTLRGLTRMQTYVRLALLLGQLAMVMNLVVCLPHSAPFFSAPHVRGLHARQFLIRIYPLFAVGWSDFFCMDFGLA